MTSTLIQREPSNLGEADGPNRLCPPGIHPEIAGQDPLFSVCQFNLFGGMMSPFQKGVYNISFYLVFSTDIYIYIYLDPK